MDAISYAHSAKQEQRIKKFINDPDSTSGVLTVPKTIASGENITIPSGRVAVLPNVQIDGTLNVQGDVFIPSGATLSSVVEKVTSTDNAIVRFDGTTGKVQNSGVFIDDNNNVGIGTSSPTSPLTVKTTSSYLTQDYLGDSTNGYVGIRFRNSGNTATTCFQNYDNGSYKIGTVGTDSVQLWTNNTERMRIDSAGNVGIGVSDPDRKLEVYSSVPSIKISDSNAKSGVPGSIAKLEFAQHYGTITSSSIEGYQDGTATDYQKGGLKFLTNNGTTLNEAMRIDTVGNVGIGVTPSANYKLYTTPNYTGSANIGTVAIGASGANYGSIGYNFITTGTSYNYLYNINNLASMIRFDGGGFNFFTAPSGTAGNTITWTNAMTLDASGNLNVGLSGASYHAFYKNGGGTAGTGVIFMIANAGSDSVVNVMNATSMGMSNSAGTAIRVAISSTTLRSINAAGTINAAGADYAEYEYSNDINLVKGQIVGFKEDGTLTDKYSESIRFAIKSTNPSIVGGDVWGCENIVGIRPEKPVRKLDITEQKLIKDAVLGDDKTILEDAVYETVIIEKGDSDKEWKLIYSTYEKDLADFEARLEAERQKVDRIAYAGKVPVNVYGAVAGQYVIAIEKEDGTIDGKLVNKIDMTFSEYQDAVGRVNKILDDGRAEVAVIVH